jgi:glycerol-3-phosphate dehydrogenase
MPIVAQIYRVLYEGLAPRDAVTALMSRPIGHELD